MDALNLIVNQQPVTVYDSGITGPAVVFLHGNSHHGGTFRPLLHVLPEENYRVILIDLPGHGASSAAVDPDWAYNIPGYADTLVEIVRELGVEDAVFIGHSLGGHVIMEALPSLNHARGALLMGAPPVSSPADVGEAFLPNPAAQAFFKENMTSEEAIGLRQALADAPTDFRDEVLAAYEETDPEARVGLAESVAAGKFSDEKSAIANAPVPLAILIGEDDQLINPDYFDTLSTGNLWLGAVQRLPGCGHWAHALPDDQVAMLVNRYLRDCVAHA